MKLLTKAIEAKLRSNSKKQRNGTVKYSDIKPVVKFFNPVGNSTWLISEMDGTDELFGLCDLGMGFPELGYVSLSEIAAHRGFLNMGIERDISWTAKKTLIEYADEANELGRIKA